MGAVARLAVVAVVWPAMGAAPSGAAADPDRAREVARQILSEEPFVRRRSPRPFEGVFQRLGEWIVDPVRRLLARAGDTVPDIGSPLWLLLAVAVLVVAAVVAARLARNRSRERFVRAGAGAGEEEDDPAELEARALAAERRGDLAEALRLRFRGGLLRLDRLGAIDLRPGLTNAAAVRALRSRRFEGLACDFDEIVYGGRPATGVDVEEARAGWPRVLHEARPR